MTDRKPEKSKTEADSDTMHGRSHAGASFGASQDEQTRDIERTGRPEDDALDDTDLVTNAEIAARKRCRMSDT
jgi:hypothetical protein